MPETGFVNQGPDRRFGGWFGRWLARGQRRSAFKSSTPPIRTVTGSREEGYLLEIAYSQPGRKPFIGFAIPRGTDRWDTFRIGWRWDPNWGDANVKGYNPQPSVVGGYFFDVIVKKSQRRPHIDPVDDATEETVP